MLKKQTVWLLTMLSLMIVLSVYYMTSDSEDIAYIDDGQSDQGEAVTTDSEAETEGEAGAEVEDINNVGQDELFTTLRMEVQDQRSMEKDRLTDVVASSTASSDEKDQALKDIDVLEEAATKETILEEQIMGAAAYQDVLVRSEDDKVHVHVKVDSLSESEANNIMQMVRDEFGEVVVDVNYQPTESEGEMESEDDMESEGEMESETESEGE
ncbi:SpoIIIAH-like family protein [Virgibacillus sp. NKC19-16]|uniref:SpoIIIAH-like family protein n=1 Tax=Virgibacillus salidurans TaxID=2831673 RepID=UPI001F47A273|nr:SpoIIIAH-like family protein [Virgibacillus sp. NKC19-16]UJL44812.1 SpoIIIAH-like family protein [Virgibacillus sp. NKC19-16]